MDTRTLCLGVLTQGPASGYEIKKAIEEHFGYFLEVSHSSIYPALAELLKEGMVSCEEVQQAGKPDKKVYGLTDAGRKAFVDGLVRSPGRHRIRSEFLILLFFAEYLPPARLVALLNERVSEFDQLLSHAENCCQGEGGLSAGTRFAAGLGHAALSAAAAYIRDNRGWLEAELAAQKHSD